jgi:hypothetical protein
MFLILLDEFSIILIGDAFGIDLEKRKNKELILLKL